jgi:hypothetical protein
LLKIKADHSLPCYIAVYFFMQKGIIVLICLLLGIKVYSQNYTSTTDGSWTTAANWSNTSGWGTSTPPIDGSQGSGTITMQNNMSVSGNYTLGSPTLNISSGKTLTVNGNMTLNGGSTVNVSGNLTITGDLTLSGVLNILPGGTVTVNGSVYVNSSNYLIVGTAVAPPAYARLIIYHNLVSQSSGDVTVKQNGEVAVFGNFSSSSSGGSVVKLDSGGQMYVNGTSTFAGGGDHLTNNNTSQPYGFYSNNNPTYSGGGAGSNGSAGANSVGNVSTMQTQDPGFYAWISSLTGNPLPITLIFFKATIALTQRIDLEWATSSELNFDYFIIERSADGKSFESVATIKGQGTTNQRQDYQYTDNWPLAGISYYRLKSVDFDGYTETFSSVAVKNDSEKSVHVFPIPVENAELNVYFNFELNRNATLTVMDLSGQEVQRTNLLSGQSIYHVECTAKPGVYLLRIQSDEITQLQRISVK